MIISLHELPTSYARSLVPPLSIHHQRVHQSGLGYSHCLLRARHPPRGYARGCRTGSGRGVRVPRCTGWRSGACAGDAPLRAESTGLSQGANRRMAYEAEGGWDARQGSRLQQGAEVRQPLLPEQPPPGREGRGQTPQARRGRNPIMPEYRPTNGMQKEWDASCAPTHFVQCRHSCKCALKSRVRRHDLSLDSRAFLRCCRFELCRQRGCHSMKLVGWAPCRKCRVAKRVDLCECRREVPFEKVELGLGGHCLVPRAQDERRCTRSIGRVLRRRDYLGVASVNQSTGRFQHGHAPVGRTGARHRANLMRV